MIFWAALIFFCALLFIVLVVQGRLSGLVSAMQHWLSVLARMVTNNLSAPVLLFGAGVVMVGVSVLVVIRDIRRRRK